MGETIERVGVIGLGQMGAGIAEVFARGGLAVVGVEPTPDALERGRGHLQRSTDRAVQRGRLSGAEQQAIIHRVMFTTTIGDVAECDLVIEAIPERLDLKLAAFRELDQVCGPSTILATNTSSLSVTEIAAATGRPHRVVGMHFFNPAPVMALVEVIRTVVTDPDVVAEVIELAHRLGKTEVSITDRAGFVANTLLLGYLNHAVTLLEAGAVDRDDLEAAMRLGAGLPMGPLALCDLIGTDTVVEILDTIHRETGSRRYVAAPLLRRMVAAGLLGRKAGRGFFSYEPVGASGDRDSGDPRAEPDRVAPSIGLIGTRLEIVAFTETCPMDGMAVLEVELADDSGEWTASQREDLQRCDLLVEVASPEVEPSAELAERCRRVRLLELVGTGTAVLATTSPTASLTAIAAATRRPDRLVGLRVRPSRAGRVIELTGTSMTSADMMAQARSVAERLSEHVISVDDRAGGVVDGLVMPYLNDALRLVDEHYATEADVDAAMTLGCGYPVGPIALLDDLGPERAYGVLLAMHAETGEPSLAPVRLLRQLVESGRAGRRTGRGGHIHPAG